MTTLYDALAALSPTHDDELLDGYRRYEAAVARVLTPEQTQAYAEAIRNAATVRIFDEMTADEIAALGPNEQAVAAAIVADQDATMENRRVVALLNQRGEHGKAPDLASEPQAKQPEDGIV